MSIRSSVSAVNHPNRGISHGSAPKITDELYSEVISVLTQLREKLLQEIRIMRETLPAGEDHLNAVDSQACSAKLLRISDALNRIRHGVYGLCRLCKEPIAKERLIKHPLSRFCEECHVKREASGRSLRLCP